MNPRELRNHSDEELLAKAKQFRVGDKVVCPREGWGGIIKGIQRNPTSKHPLFRIQIGPNEFRIAAAVHIEKVEKLQN